MTQPPVTVPHLRSTILPAGKLDATALTSAPTTGFSYVSSSFWMDASGFAAACRVSAEGADGVGREPEHAARITGARIRIRSGFIKRNLSSCLGSCLDF